MDLWWVFSHSNVPGTCVLIDKNVNYALCCYCKDSSPNKKELETCCEWTTVFLVMLTLTGVVWKSCATFWQTVVTVIKV